jgi:hypothetical protein
MAGRAACPVVICDEPTFTKLVPEELIVDRIRQLDPEWTASGNGTSPDTLKLAVTTVWRDVGVSPPRGVQSGDIVVLVGADRVRSTAEALEVSRERLLDVIILHELAHYLDEALDDRPGDSPFEATRAEHHAQLMTWNALTLLPPDGHPAEAMAIMRRLADDQPECYSAFFELPSIRLSRLPAAGIDRAPLVVPVAELGLNAASALDIELQFALADGDVVYLANLYAISDLEDWQRVAGSNDTPAILRFEQRKLGRELAPEQGLQEIVGPWRVTHQEAERYGRPTRLYAMSANPIFRHYRRFDADTAPITTPVLFEAIVNTLSTESSGSSS